MQRMLLYLLLNSFDISEKKKIVEVFVRKSISRTFQLLLIYYFEDVFDCL